jgi:hypothetical protein
LPENPVDVPFFISPAEGDVEFPESPGDVPLIGNPEGEPPAVVDFGDVLFVGVVENVMFPAR